MFIDPIVSCEILDLVNGLDASKSPGHDSIYVFFKELYNFIGKSLVQYIGLLNQKRQFPSDTF